ncbi:MAG TPA: hypothetical protein VNA16_01215 [Abditibacteriaceae bacterium]|nr:hypothetical protein [Abditibacteriaceae bacterium]
MVVPNLLFDAILFGALLLAAVLDSSFASLYGGASLLAVGAATYVAAQELSDALARRHWWTQESLTTALSLSTAGFIYFWWRNGSDLALLVLSIGLMMASLMAAIAVIGGCSTALKEKSPRPLAGLLFSVMGALILGLLAGLLTLNAPLLPKLIVIMVAMVWWKLRENVRPPAQNPLSQEALAVSTPAVNRIPPPVAGYGERNYGPTRHTSATLGLTAHPSGRWALIPQRGTLLDRFLPVLLLGAVLFFTFQQAGRSFLPSAPSASADSNTAQK